MGDRVLLVVGELGHRAPGRVVGDEDRVVPEAAAARRLGGQRPPAAALEEALLAAGRHVGDHADVAGAAARRRLAVELREVLCFRRRLTGEPCGPHAGAPAERLGLYPGVVGDRRNRAVAARFAPVLREQRRGGPGLDERVLGVGLAGLLRAAGVRRQRRQVDAGQQPLELAELVGVTGGEQQPQGGGPPRSLLLFLRRARGRVRGPNINTLLAEGGVLRLA